MRNFKEIYMYAFGALVMILLFVITYVLIFHPIPESNKDLLLLAAGIIFAWGSQIVGYFFGSSKGSADKSELLSK